MGSTDSAEGGSPDCCVMGWQGAAAASAPLSSALGPSAVQDLCFGEVVSLGLHSEQRLWGFSVRAAERPSAARVCPGCPAELARRQRCCSAAYLPHCAMRPAPAAGDGAAGAAAG